MLNRYANVVVRILWTLVVLGLIFRGELGDDLAITIIVLMSLCVLAVKYLLRKYGQDRLYKPLEERELPSSFRKYLKDWSPEMDRARMELIGDFLIHPEPLALYSRAYLSEDNRSFGYLAWYDERFLYGFFSVFEDGTYFESSSLKPGPYQPLPDSPLKFSYLPDAPLESLREFHSSEIDRIEESHRTRVISWTPECYVKVSEYGGRLTDWDQYEQGLRWIPPKPIETPESTTGV